MKILKILIGWPISVLSFFFLTRILLSRSTNLPNINELNLPILLLSVFCFFAYSLLRGILWQEILKQKRYKISFKESLKLWVFSEFKRYAPGNIWSLVGRVLSFESVGVLKKDSARALLYEAELITLGALLGSLIAFPVIFNILPDSQFEVFFQPALFMLVSTIFLSFVLARKLKIKFFPNFNYKANIRLVLISFISFFFFGVGSYLTTVSIFYINPQNFLLLSGYFIFALLVGYLSFVTPMGLGVREGVLFLGLSLYLTSPQAAIAVIFARVIFILSELAFLGIVWFWNKTKNRTFQNIESLIKRNTHMLILIIGVLVYILYFANTTFLRHDNFFSGRFDLGNMDQTVWNTIHGRIFELTNPNGTNIISRLSFHADFILVLLSPLYFLWKDPKMLLLIQSIILSFGSIFVFLISQKILKNKNISLILGFAYLINPAINYSNLFDFHPVVLATTFLLAAFYFLLSKKYIQLLTFLILAGLTKEQIWITISFFGIYLFFLDKKKILGSIIFILSILIFYVLIFVAIPNFSGGKHFALSYYSDFGDSPLGILKRVIKDPVNTLVFIFQNGQLDYLKKMLYPFAFLPIFSPYLIFAVPDLFINLLSNNSQLHEITYQYTAAITPFLFIAAIYSIKTLMKHTPNFKIAVYTAIIFIFSFYSAYEFGPLPGAKYPHLEMYNNQLSNKKEINQVLDGIPKRYSIASTNNLGAHLSHRQRIYTVPLGMTEADVVLFLIKDPESNFAAKQELIWLLQVENNTNFEKFVENGQFVGFKKKGLKLKPVL